MNTDSVCLERTKIMKNYPEQLTAEYEMLECLAAHDNSETILASRKSDGKLCVIKLFFSEGPMYNFAVPKEIKELEHPSIPKFIGEYKSDEVRYEIREYIPGVSLDKLGIKNQLTKEQKDSITSKLIDVLQFLHSRKEPVIHRDIKPQNIIIDEDGEAYLIDFGIARMRSEEPETSDTVICTTRDFSAPEQYGFMETDCRSDIYSFGQALRWLYGDESKEIDSIIDKCTAFDPNDRYSSIKEVKRAINAKKKSKKRRPYIITAAAVVGILLAIYLIAYNSDRFKEPLIEDAVRLSLGVSKLHPLTSAELRKVEGIYIVADIAFANADEFYSGMDTWYFNKDNNVGSLVSLEDCGKLENLKELCVGCEMIEDLSPLRKCRQLEKVEIKHNKVSDISVLGELENITSVGINDNPVTDISPLIKLKKLRYLDTCNVKVDDPSVYGKLGDFEYLDIDNGTQAYMHLSGKIIKRLRLGNIYTKDLLFLKDIKGLESVQLNFINRKKIEKLGDVDFEVIYEGIDVPVQDIPYKKVEE